MKLPKWLPLLCVAFLLGGCAAPVDRIANTESGRPEVTINADLAAVKSGIINKMVNHDFNVESDTDYMLKLSKPITDPTQNMIASMTVGNAYSVNRAVLTYVFAKQPDGSIRVVATPTITSQMPGGLVNSSDLADNKTFNKVQEDLYEVKTAVEAVKPTK